MPLAECPFCAGLKDRRAGRCQSCYELSKHVGSVIRGQLRSLPKLCGHCGLAPATNRTGPPGCDPCKERNAREVFAAGAERRRELRAESRHDECPSCDGRKDRRAERCRDCWHRTDAFANQARRAASAGAEQRWRPDPDWRYVHPREGYVHVRHPETGETVREHRLVAELELLGRPLDEDESVHHLNGDRADNRPENLEVWTGPHPTGARVEDAVAHAVRVLKRYAPELLDSEAQRVR